MTRLLSREEVIITGIPEWEIVVALGNIGLSGSDYSIQAKQVLREESPTELLSREEVIITGIPERVVKLALGHIGLTGSDYNIQAKQVLKEESPTELLLELPAPVLGYVDTQLLNELALAQTGSVRRATILLNAIGRANEN